MVHGTGLGTAELDLPRTLQLVADTIVESLGFEVAVVNLVLDDESMVVAAVSGPDEVREALLSRRQGRAGWEELIEASVPWGRLRFLDHACSVGDPEDILSWVPDIPVSAHPDAWHPEDALFALLEAPDGRRLGTLSVDVPGDGMRPGPVTCRALEAFAVTASLAIEHAGLAARSRTSALRFQGVFDSSPIAIGLIDTTPAFTMVNDAFCRFLQRTREDLLGHDPREFSHPDDVHLTEAVARAARDETSTSAAPVEKRYVLPDGGLVWGRLHLAHLDGASAQDVLIAQVEDVTERKLAEEQLVRQAHVDPLTGLPNRALCLRFLTESLQADRVLGTFPAVFFCDLDRLKQVNDEHGHAVGDHYIRLVADRLRATVPGTDLVGRLSGDEFVVVLHEVRLAAEAVAVAEQVLAAVRQPLQIGAARFTPSMSVGIACGSRRGTTTAAELLAQADGAMYQAKAGGRGTWQLAVAEPPSRSSRAG